MNEQDFNETLQETIENIDGYFNCEPSAANDLLADFIPENADLTKQEQLDLLATLSVAIGRLNSDAIIDKMKACDYTYEFAKGSKANGLQNAA